MNSTIWEIIPLVVRLWAKQTGTDDKQLEDFKRIVRQIADRKPEVVPKKLDKAPSTTQLKALRLGRSVG